MKPINLLILHKYNDTFHVIRHFILIRVYFILIQINNLAKKRLCRTLLKIALSLGASICNDFIQPSATLSTVTVTAAAPTKARTDLPSNFNTAVTIVTNLSS